MLSITGDGNSRQHQDGKMGFYSLIPGTLHNNKHIFLQDTKDNKIFYDKGKKLLLTITRLIMRSQHQLLLFCSLLMWLVVTLVVEFCRGQQIII